MTSSALVEDPACPGPTTEELPPSGALSLDARLSVEQTPFAAIRRATWDRLATASPWATPFSDWAFHRAWWDAYGTTAHDQTLTVTDPASGATVAIVPLMHRHQVEPTDAETHTTMRHGQDMHLTRVAPTAKAVFFGASYHADYATVLAAPDVLPAVSESVVEYLAERASPDDPHPAPWDVVDLRRLRCGDPAADALAVAFGSREISEGWTARIRSLVWLTDDEVSRFTGDGPLITDDRPLPEYFLLRRLFGTPSPKVTPGELLRLTRS